MHNNQFIAISKSVKSESYSLSTEGFKNVEIGCWDFFYHKDSVVHKGIGKNGVEFVIFGICENLDGDKGAESVVRDCDSEKDFLLSSYFFSGRYVIFFGGAFYPDVCGHLQLFYDSSLSIISSSLGLIGPVLGKKVCPLRYQEFKKLGFFPAPQTIYQDVYLLLGNQKISDGRIHFLENNLSKNYLENLESDFIDATKLFISKLDKKYKLVLPLTGGIDSRTILAFLLDIKAKISSYTSIYRGILSHDVFIPKLLSFVYRFKHSWITCNKKVRLTKSKKQLFSFVKHTGHNVIDKDKLFYTYGLFPAVNEGYRKRVMLRGAGWAVFRGFYTKDLPLGGNNDERIKSLMVKFSALQECPLALKALVNWFDDYGCFRYDWRVQFYIDQRINAWDGSLEQAICLTNFHPTLITNSNYQMDLLNSWFKIDCDSIKGRTQVLQKKIIKKLKPSMNFFPYNIRKYRIMKKVIRKINFFKK